MSAPDEELLETLRPAAFAIAYRMLGSVSEAEDIVQEALLRLHRAVERGDGIESPRAYLATVTTRLAVDELRSARSRRETYVGEWLPEPIVTDGDGDPARAAEMADSLSLAILVLLESLTPEQRAVLLLRDVFDYRYDEIAEIIGKHQDNVRQLATRARRHVAERRPRFAVTPEQRRELSEGFFAAIGSGDVKALEAVLADDVVLHGDGGGRTPALAGPIHGRRRVARTITAWVRHGARIPEASLRPAEINGQPGALLLDGESIVGVWALDIADGQIQSMHAIINPDKLRHLTGAGDINALWARRGAPRRGA